MLAFHANIFALAKENTDFRRVLASTTCSQLVLMSVAPGEDIGEEVHEVDQILVFVEGSGRAVVGGVEYAISPGDVFFVATGTKHNFINTGKHDLKLFTIYAPRELREDLVQKTKS